MKRYLMIINPISGTKSKEKVEPMAREILTDIDLEVVRTEYAGHARELAADAAAKGYDAVIAVGGDGTVNEVAGGLTGSQTTMGIVPMGSGNGLARHLNIPVSIHDSLVMIARDDRVNCDTCTVNDRPFFCTFGCGFDADVALDFAQHPDRRGLVNYVRGALSQFIHYQGSKYRISLADGQIIDRQALLIACANATQYGNNTYIAPRASITDGQIDVTILHDGSRGGTLLSGVNVMAGSLHQNNRVTTLRTPSLVIEREKPGAVHLDGEPMEMGQRLEVKCRPASLWVFSSGEQHVSAVSTPLSSLWKGTVLTVKDWTR